MWRQTRRNAMTSFVLPVVGEESAATVSNRIGRISDKTAKRYVGYLQLLFVVAFVVLTVQAVWVQLDFSVPNARQKILGINIACGAICLTLIVTYAVVSYVDWRRNLTLVPNLSMAQGRDCLGQCRAYVPPRPARYFQLAIVDYAFISLVAMLFMAVDIYLSVEECGWLYSWSEVLSFLKWTFFNGLVANQFCHILSMLPREAVVKLVKVTRLGWYFRWRNIELTDGVDLPITVYVGLFVTFFITPFVCILIGMLIATGVIGNRFCTPTEGPDCLGITDPQVCDPWSDVCQVFVDSRADVQSSGRSTFLLIASSVIVAHIIIYVICLLMLARALHGMPYKRFKLVRMHLGYHIMTRIPSSLLLVLNFIFLWLIEIGSCPVQFMSNAGFGSMVLALSGVASASLWLTTPVAYGADHEEGEIAFDENKPYNKEMKISYARMIESFVFSYMVYEVDEVERYDQLFDLEEYMGVYGLEDYDMLWNKHIDSKCMVSWNSGTGKIIVAFRGTASGRNMLTDLKVWREPHDPERGNYWLGTKPMVHAGFSEFFYRSGMREECLELLQRIMEESKPGNGVDHDGTTCPPGKKWDILVCGHSLGGAAAKIAAYDISEWLESRGESFSLTCYTYGCPRVGNSAFAKIYEDAVPDTWSIMHLDDLVTKGGKFVYMFKRGGKRCFLTSGGPIVQPSYMTRVTLRGLGSSVTRHFLPSYAVSLVRTLTQHGIVDWNTPDKQRARLAIMNTKVFKHMQKNFCTEKQTLDLARKRVIRLESDDGHDSDKNNDKQDEDIDLATGRTGVHRRNSTEVVGVADNQHATNIAHGRWYVRMKAAIFSWSGSV